MRERLLSEVVELMQPAPVEMFGDDVVVGPDVVQGGVRARRGGQPRGQDQADRQCQQDCFRFSTVHFVSPPVTRCALPMILILLSVSTRYFCR